MKRLSTQRQRRSTPEERAEWVSRYRSSGLSQRRFAQEHNLALSTLRQWLYHNKRKRSPRFAPPTFHEISVAPLLAADSTAWAVELVSPKGVTLRLRERPSARDLARLLRG